ncbi:MAG: hypothetical protein IPK53_19235 [bacterium]|nr:hypothetical protein [bacterium]
MSPRPLYTSLILSVLFAVLLTATVPFFCATGWCCQKHEQQAQVVEKPSCCASEVEVKQPVGDTCCGTQKASDESDSCDQGCATGCCKIAAMPYVLSLPLTALVVPPASDVVTGTVTDTGIELSDYIPQPPRVLSA